MKTDFLIIFMLCFPVFLWADDETNYLEGAVPEVDGKVVFSEEFDIPGVDQNVLFDYVYNWLDSRMKENNNSSRIVYSEKEKGQIIASGEEYLVFTNSALSLDKALMNYNFTVFCKPGKCEVQLDRIRYNYENKRVTAEEQIADQVALNKNKTAIFRGVRKFRVMTVDYVDDFFNNIRTAFGIQEVQSVTPALIAQTQPVNPTPVNPVVTPINIQPNQKNETVVPIVTGSETFQGYKQLLSDKIPGNIIKMLSEDWMLITAGTDEKFNMMTASWGGLGMLYGKPVAFCFINPARYTYQLMETNDTYTLAFYTEAYREVLNYIGTNSGRDMDKVKGSGLTPVTMPSGSKAFSEAWLIIECRKLVAQSLSHDALFNEQIKSEWTGKQLHKMYIGEILNVWVK